MSYYKSNALNNVLAGTTYEYTHYRYSISDPRNKAVDEEYFLYYNPKVDECVEENNSIFRHKFRYISTGDDKNRYVCSRGVFEIGAGDAEPVYDE